MKWSSLTRDSAPITHITAISRVIVITAVFFALLSFPFATAQEPTEEGAAWSGDDYSSPQPYSDSQFLATSDPSQWDYSQPALYENFAEIPLNQYEKIQWDRFEFGNAKFSMDNVPWDNYDSFPSSFHSSLAQSTEGLDKYCSSFGHGGCTFDFDAAAVAGITFDGNGLSSAAGYAELQRFPPGTSYTVDEQGVMIITPPRSVQAAGAYPSEWREGKVPALGKDTIAVIDLRSPDPRNKFRIGDTEIDGFFNYNLVGTEEWSITPGQMVRIKNIEVEVPFSQPSVIVYGIGDNALERNLRWLEGQEDGIQQIYTKLQEGKDHAVPRAVYFGDEVFIASDVVEGREPTYTVRFRRENPYVAINRARYGEQLHDDVLEISPLHGAFILERRSTLEVLRSPSATIAGNVRMRNGHRQINVEEGHVFSTAVVYEQQSDSVPMDIAIRMQDYAVPAYAETANSKGEKLGNTITIREEHKVDFDGTSHFSVSVDPNRVMSLGEDSFEVLDELKGTNVKDPFLIVVTPAKSNRPEEHNAIREATELLQANLGPDVYPITIELENAGFDIESVSSSEQDRRLEIHQRALNRLQDEKSLGKYNFRVIGHSAASFSVFGSRIERQGVATAGIEDIQGGLPYDRQVSFSEKHIPRLLGCSIADEEVNGWGSRFVDEKVQTGEYIEVSADSLSDDIRYGCQAASNVYGCMLEKSGADVLVLPTGVTALGERAARERNANTAIQANSRPVETLLTLKLEEGKTGPIVTEASVPFQSFPLMTAVHIAQAQPENRQKPLEELVVAVQDTVHFPNCRVAREAEALVQDAYGFGVRYQC